MSNKDFKVIKLEKDNFVVWKWQMKNVLKAKGWDGALLNGFNEHSQEALALLGSALSDENILKIINCSTFLTALVTFEQCYENKTTYKPQALYLRLNSFKIASVVDVSSGAR